jgi:hypothetical protein
VFSNGKVLLAGGEDIDVGTALSTTESFDPTSASLTFSSGVSLQVARMRAANAFSASQNVLVLIGGSSQAPATEQVPSP